MASPFLSEDILIRGVQILFRFLPSRLALSSGMVSILYGSFQAVNLTAVTFIQWGADLASRHGVLEWIAPTLSSGGVDLPFIGHPGSPPVNGACYVFWIGVSSSSCLSAYDFRSKTNVGHGAALRGSWK
ncbi:hypothetical protein FNV43_RR01153 [Rhamnella rubrinervis]|uniref:Uncharacterized protein n=1 Tax=Rhamnella rubrinervis TaxID=2594499 RepID=A0A8K0MRT2_9ROSA|nr:hypothetical protein FNV43_RR01153 [Rhamnella rubrinervis]